MSGEKCAQAHLTEEARRVLEHLVGQLLAFEETLIELADIEQEVERFEAAFGQHAQRYMAADYASYRAAASLSLARAQELRSQLERVRDTKVFASYRSLPQLQQAIEQTEGQVQEVKRLKTEFTQARERLRHNMEEIRNNLRSRINEAEIRERIQLERRQALEGLVNDIESALTRDRALDFFHERVKAVLSHLREVIRSGSPLAENIVAQFREDWKQLREEALQRRRARLLEDRSQQFMVATVKQVFEELGFACVMNPTRRGHSIAVAHEMTTDPRVVLVDTSVPREGPLQFQMHARTEQGREESAEINIEADNDCPERILEVVEHARQLGLDIVSVTGPGPDGDVIYYAQSSTNETVHVTPKRKNREMEHRS